MMAAEFAVTFFGDYTAATKREERFTPADLAALIKETTAPSKEALPWLKLARVGNHVSPKGSLRHDRNVIAVSGVELDYDGEVVGVDEAVETAEKAALEAIVYTSPSHTLEKPRWRILCRTSRELPPGARAHMAARVNGLYRGIFAGESFTLSQSYYYGGVDGNPDHRVEVIDGTPIDELDELDLIAIGKPHTKPGNGAGNGQWRDGPIDQKGLLAAIMTGESYHNSAMRLLGYWGSNGISMLEAKARLEAAFDGVDRSARDPRWQDRRNEIPKLLEYIWKKEADKRDAERNAFVVDRDAPLATARLFIEREHTTGTNRTVHHHRGSFYRWSGTEYIEAVRRHCAPSYMHS